MTTIENLEIVKAALLEKRDAIELAHSALEKEAKEEKKAIFEKLFEEEISYHPEVEVSVGSSSIYFSIENREIASISERSYWRTEDGVNSFQVIISSFALGAEVCFTVKEVERFLKRIVAS